MRGWTETCSTPVLCLRYTLRKQSTFRDAIAGFHAKWRLSNDWRNPILLTRHLPDLGLSDWLKQIFHMAQPTRSTDTSSAWNFWRSFLRRYLVGKPLVTLQKGSCFLRLFSFSCRHRYCLFWAYSHLCEVSQGFSISNRVFGNLRFK